MPRVEARSSLMRRGSTAGRAASTQPTAIAERAADERNQVGLKGKDRPKEHVDGGARRARRTGVRKRRISAASPSAAPSTMPVATSRPRGRLMPINSMTPAAMRFMTMKPVERVRRKQKCGRAAGSANVRQGMACERLTAGHSEQPDNTGHDGYQTSNDERGLDGGTREETRARNRFDSDRGTSDDVSRPVQRPDVAERGVFPAGYDDDSPVDTNDVDVVSIKTAQAPRSRRPHSLFRWRRARLATYAMRSITGSSGFMSWVEISTAICCSCAIPGRTSTTSCSLRMSRLASGSSKRSRRGRLISACAIRMRCCSPPESRRHGRWRSWRVDRSQHLVDSFPPRTPRGTGSPRWWPSIPSATRSRARSGISGSSRESSEARSRSAGCVAERGRPSISTRPDVGEIKPKYHPQKGRLSRRRWIRLAR